MKTVLMVIYVLAFVLTVLRSFSDHLDRGPVVLNVIVLVLSFAGMMVLL